MFEKFDDEELLGRCLEAAEEIPSFNPSFLYSLKNTIEEYGSLTENQRDSLEKIACQWGML
jgi:hypothetical protein